MPAKTGPNTQGVKVEFIGAKELVTAFTNLELSVRSRAKEMVQRHSLALANGAKKLCPVDMGQLRASIRPTFYNNGLTSEVATNVGYGAFVEFGTGPLGASTAIRASVPADYVYGPGNFFPPIQVIKDWCKRHGVPENLAFVIARKIGKRGVKAQPFMWVSYETMRPEFEADLKRLMP